MNEQLIEFTVCKLLSDYGKARQIYQFMLSTQFAIIDKKTRNSLITLNNRNGRRIGKRRRYRTKVHGEMYTVVLEYLPDASGQVETDQERT